MSTPLTSPQPRPTRTAVKRMPAKPNSWVATVVGEEDPVDRAAAEADGDGGEEDAGEAELLGGDGGRPDGGQGDDRADRQVDAAGGDDEGHADGDDTDDGRLGEDQLQVAGVEELVRFGEASDEDQDGEHPEQGERAHVGAEQDGAPGRGAGGRRRLADGVPRRGDGLRHVAGLPSMTRSSTRCSSSSRAGAEWTTRPSRRTRTRSARPRTSGTSLETSSTARPSSASRRTTAYSSARAPTSTPRVGSSSSSTRQPRSSQ